MARSDHPAAPTQRSYAASASATATHSVGPTGHSIINAATTSTVEPVDAATTAGSTTRIMDRPQRGADFCHGPGTPAPGRRADHGCLAEWRPTNASVTRLAFRWRRATPETPLGNASTFHGLRRRARPLSRSCCIVAPEGRVPRPISVRPKESRSLWWRLHCPWRLHGHDAIPRQATAICPRTPWHGWAAGGVAKWRQAHTK